MLCWDVLYYTIILLLYRAVLNYVILWRLVLYYYCIVRWCVISHYTMLYDFSYAYIMESVTLKYVLINKSNCDLMQIGGELNSLMYSIALPKG